MRHAGEDWAPSLSVLGVEPLCSVSPCAPPRPTPRAADGDPGMQVMGLSCNPVTQHHFPSPTSVLLSSQRRSDLGLHEDTAR